jgi:hypothetical protein
MIDFSEKVNLLIRDSSKRNLFAKNGIDWAEVVYLIFYLVTIRLFFLNRDGVGNLRHGS